MSTRRDLPPRVYRKHGAFWHVAAQGPKRIWTRLCPIADGIPAMYRALAELETAEIHADTMPKDIVATYNAHTYDAERLEWLGKLDQHLEGLAGSHTQ